MILLFSFTVNAKVDQNQEITIKDVVTGGNINPGVALNLLQQIIIADGVKRAREAEKAQENKEAEKPQQ